MSSIASGTVFEEEIFDNVDLGGVGLAGKELSRCVFRGCNFTSTTWRGVALEDCTFEECDLSNLRLAGASLRGVEFRGTKLIGTTWADFGVPPVVSFIDCNLRYLAGAGFDLRLTTFTRCVLAEARFLDVNLTKSVFAECDLAQATFEQCTLVGADFTTSTNVYFDAQKNRVKGARINLDAAGRMAAALGLVVKG
jgi:uncharacterized protein YjbI with pentapeptide repeats